MDYVKSSLVSYQPSIHSPGQLAQIACLLEVTARKPGNIHRYADFKDTGYLDFLLSAAAIARPLDRACEIGVGRAVLEAVEATRRVVATNTNLGIILLLAPLAAVPLEVEVLKGLDLVLENLKREDAQLVYQAIRIAKPGGLGSAREQDIAEEPSVNLLEAMKLAANRDLIARQYGNRYAEVFGVALPEIRAALSSGQPLETAIITSYLNLLARCPDTLIARKRGPEVAAEASRRAAEVLARGWPETGMDALQDFDYWLRLDDHARNPGTTADLIAAALFLALREGTITLPMAADPSSWTFREE